MQNQFWLQYLGFTFTKILSFFLLSVLHSSALYNESSGMLPSLEL